MILKNGVLSVSRRKITSFKYSLTAIAQEFTQDETVACRDLGKVSFERGRLLQNVSTRTRCLFPNAPDRAPDSFSNVPIRARDQDVLINAIIQVVDTARDHN